MAIPGIFEQTVLSPAVSKKQSKFIRPMHPKTEIRPQPQTIRKLLAQGWIAQPKIHGHRVQLHISANPEDPIIAYTRKGTPHKAALHQDLESDLRRLLQPDEGWNVVDGEWLKSKNKIFLFDFIKHQDRVLYHLNYLERLALLPRVYRSDFVETLPVLTTVEKALTAYEHPDHEGLVFKATKTTGFEDTSIIRCRRVNRYIN